MKLTRIRLEDFRCFGEADFDLTDRAIGLEKPLDVALFVGGNGSGKSAVLQALTGFFTGIASRRYGGKLLSPHDIRQGASSARVHVSWCDSVLAEGPSVGESLAVAATLDVRPWFARGERSSLERSSFERSSFDHSLEEWIQRATPQRRHPAGLIVRSRSETS